MPGLEPINFYYYPSMRIDATLSIKSWVFRTALYWVEVYVNGLVLQWNRMVDETTMGGMLMHEDLMSNVEAAKVSHQFSDHLRLDIHFFLICWDKVHKHFKTVAETAESECIVDAWERIRGLVEDASKARNFFEHLDKTVMKGSHGETGHSFLTPGQFVFRYVDVRNNGQKIQREVTLGRDEVKRVMVAYEQVLSCLGANLNGGVSASR